MSRLRTVRTRGRWSGWVWAMLLGILSSACSTRPPVPSAMASEPPAAGGEAPVYVLDSGFPQPSTISFDQVTWMQVDWRTGWVYLLQRSQPPVSVWTPAGELVRSWDTQALGDPHSISLENLPDGSQRVWITDMAPPLYAGQGFGHCLKQFTTEGELLSTLGTCGPDSQGAGLDPVQFDKVTDIAFGAEGERYVTDGDLDGLNNRLLAIDRIGRVVRDWSAPDNQPGSGPGEFDLPHDVEVDSCQRLWIADALNHRVQVIGSGGEVVGELDCFGDDGVYGIALTGALEASTGAWFATLFVTTSPTTGGGRGTVYVFDVPLDCQRPSAIGECRPVTRWDVELPATEQTSLLHAVTTDRDGTALYISLLGGSLPPQKWVRVSGTDSRE